MPTAFHGSGCQIFSFVLLSLSFYVFRLFFVFFFSFLEVYSEHVCEIDGLLQVLCEEGGPSFHTCCLFVLWVVSCTLPMSRDYCLSSLLDVLYFHNSIITMHLELLCID